MEGVGVSLVTLGRWNVLYQLKRNMTHPLQHVNGVRLHQWIQLFHENSCHSSCRLFSFCEREHFPLESVCVRVRACECVRACVSVCVCAPLN